MIGTLGKGKTSGTHHGNDIWPGRNNVLFVACEENDGKQLLSCVKHLHSQLGQEGIKAFMWDLENIT